MEGPVCALVSVQFYFKARKMQNILECISHEYCQGKQICLLFKEWPGDGFWFGQQKTITQNVTIRNRLCFSWPQRAAG